MVMLVSTLAVWVTIGTELIDLGPGSADRSTQLVGNYYLVDAGYGNRIIVKKGRGQDLDEIIISPRVEQLQVEGNVIVVSTRPAIVVDDLAKGLTLLDSVHCENWMIDAQSNDIEKLEGSRVILGCR